MTENNISVLDNLLSEHVVKDEQEKNNLLTGLVDATQDLDKFQESISDYTFIRNQIVCKLYKEHGVSAIALSNLTNLSRQMIHKIVKDNTDEEIY